MNLINILLVYVFLTLSKIHGSLKNKVRNLNPEQLREYLLQKANDDTYLTSTHLGYVALCLSARNEHSNIREWIQYHLWLGVNKIYIFDQESNPPMSSILRDFVKQGHVEVFYFRDSFKVDDFLAGYYNYRESWAANLCLKWFGHRHKFMGILDTDEFIVFPKDSQLKIQNYLNNFQNEGGIKIYRRFFGSNGHVQRPIGGVLESYTKCAKNVYSYKDAKFKVIVNMKFYGGICKIHSCRTTKKMVVANPEKVQLFHYYVKSYEDLQKKIIRQSYLLNKTMEDVMGRVDSLYSKVNQKTGYDCLQGIELFEMCCSNINNYVENNNNNTLDWQNLQELIQ
eukprot:TRINITY_DN17284_c0_g2_i2.p1 TRINITY_DN17284_c0_g2~~TRINITY_DN17284_c0_g2_i2.p1  ORF type:complete len:339 (-),score=24.72 TRINITY_DN17284_c0_g2_i2:644-1660(-)